MRCFQKNREPGPEIIRYVLLKAQGKLWGEQPAQTLRKHILFTSILGCEKLLKEYVWDSGKSWFFCGAAGLFALRH